MTLSRNFSLNSKLCFPLNKREKQMIHSDWWLLLHRRFIFPSVMKVFIGKYISRQQDKREKRKNSEFSLLHYHCPDLQVLISAPFSRLSEALFLLQSSTIYQWWWILHYSSSSTPVSHLLPLPHILYCIHKEVLGGKYRCLCNQGVSCGLPVLLLRAQAWHGMLFYWA